MYKKSRLVSCLDNCAANCGDIIKILLTILGINLGFIWRVYNLTIDWKAEAPWILSIASSTL